MVMATATSVMQSHQQSPAYIAYQPNDEITNSNSDFSIVNSSDDSTKNPDASIKDTVANDNQSTSDVNSIHVTNIAQSQQKTNCSSTATDTILNDDEIQHGKQVITNQSQIHLAESTHSTAMDGSDGPTTTSISDNNTDSRSPSSDMQPSVVETVNCDKSEQGSCCKH